MNDAEPRAWYSFINLLRQHLDSLEFIYLTPSLAAANARRARQPYNPYDLDIVSHACRLARRQATGWCCFCTSCNLTEVVCAAGVAATLPLSWYGAGAAAGVSGTPLSGFSVRV
ncbi:dynein heavy chain [Pseudoscourfieldia marina]